jgi:ABC-type amino acid transport substrate-binding protein/cytochrome c5
MSKLFHSALKTGLSSVAFAAAVFASPAAVADPLRVCSDPDNLPFSKSDGPDKGLYIELAEKVGQRLGTTVEYVWWLSFNQRRALRNTMDGCDAYFALPADAEYRVKGIEKSKPFLNVSYAIVSPVGQVFTGLDDLKGRNVGVLYGSPPLIMLASREGFTWTTFRSHDELFAALNKGELDVALMWGPSAGFDNIKNFNSRWQVQPIRGEGLGGEVAVAVSKAKPELREQINQALEALKPDIQQLVKKYGFPTQTPLLINSANKTQTHRQPAVVASSNPKSSGFIKVGSNQSQQREWIVANAGDSIAEAKSNFNNKCSHCHGSNGASPISERDLRKLSMRYQSEWKDVAYTTITKGRPDLGMPTWAGILPDEEIKAIIDFLVTVQKN